MSIWIAILFGIIQGFCEFLPVSSTAHLAMLGNLFGVSSGSGNYDMFCAFLHFGSVLSVLISFLNDMVGIVKDGRVIFSGSSQKRYPALRLVYLMLFASLPLIAVVPAAKYISVLAQNTVFTGFMLIVNGFLLFMSERFIESKKDEKNTMPLDAIIVGLCQIVGAIPGISRVGVTYTGGRAMGFKRSFAVKFAVMLSALPLLGNNIIAAVNAAKSGFAISELPACLIGMAVALVTGVFAIRIFENSVKDNNLHGYSYYCYVAGFMFIILTMIF